MRIALFLPAAALLAASCAGAADDAVATHTLPASTVAALQALPTLNAAGEGRRLFLQLNCYGCHGMFAAGGMGPNIVHAEKGDVQEVLMQGSEEGMPSFRSYVNSTDIANIEAYLQSIGSAKEPTFMDWWKKNPKK